MKLSKAILSAIVLLYSGSAIAKNVVDLKFTDDQIKNITLEMQQHEFQLGKREAKNVVDLNLIYDGDLEKREAKNVFNAQLISDENELSKRDGKNVFDIDLVIDEASLSKRDGKNVFNIHFIIDDNGELKKEGSSTKLNKRDPKNVVNLNLIFDDSDLFKRDIENTVDISLSIPKDENYLFSLQDPMSLGYIIGDSEYIAEKYENTDDDDINITLKKDSHGCHMMKTKLNFGEKLSKVLDTFKEKISDPIVKAKDKFVVPEKFLGQDVDVHNALLDPVKGDIATALTQRKDLTLYAKYLRDSPELYKKCESIQSINNEGTTNQILVFAPTNDALKSLPEKPWQFPEDINSAQTEREEDEIIQRNIINFVESHAAETDHFNISENSVFVDFITLNGKQIVLENSGDSFKVKSKGSEEWSTITDIEILENGAILTIDKPLIHN